MPIPWSVTANVTPFADCVVRSSIVLSRSPTSRSTRAVAPKYWCSIYREEVQDSHRALVLRSNSRNAAGDGYLASRNWRRPITLFRIPALRLTLHPWRAGGRRSTPPAWNRRSKPRRAGVLPTTPTLSGRWPTHRLLASIDRYLRCGVLQRGFGAGFRPERGPCFDRFHRSDASGRQADCRRLPWPCGFAQRPRCTRLFVVKDREVTGFSNSEEISREWARRRAVFHRG